MCELVNVPESSYYNLKKKVDKKEDNKELLDLVLKTYIKFRQSYGAVRIRKQFKKLGILKYSLRDVRKAMAELNISSVYAKYRRKKVKTTESDGSKRYSKNLLNQIFVTDALNQIWLGDVTYVQTEEGWCYLATVMDLFSRKIIGYSFSKTNDARNCCQAYLMAIKRRGNPEEFIYHSDRGSTYSSEEYKRLLSFNKVTQSMSRSGNCYDNSVMESFFATIKIELIYELKYRTMILVKNSVSEWIESFYNAIRMHSALDDLSPDEFETLHFTKVA
jgi:putative transposase